MTRDIGITPALDADTHDAAHHGAPFVEKQQSAAVRQWFKTGL